MNHFSRMLNDNIINVLGWSIFNIIWQGFIVAAFLFIILKLLKEKDARIKYIVSVISLCLLCFLFFYNISIHFYEFKGKTDFGYQNEEHISENYAIVTGKPTKDTFESERLFFVKEDIKSIDKYFPLFVYVWLFGILFFVVKFLGGFFYIFHLKSKSSPIISKEWISLFSSLKNKLKIKTTVLFLESKFVKVPLVLGCLKPTVIIPVQILTGIPANQVEAIIAHELAHIKRNDYIINVLQSIIETLLFFHPAVWYISLQIKKERENCCDDLALTVCEGSLVYAKALVSIQELLPQKQSIALAFGENKKYLLNRIKRLIMKPKNKLNNVNRIIAACVIFLGILALSFTYKADLTNYSSEAEASFFNKKRGKHIVELKDTTKKEYSAHSKIEIDDNTVTRIYKNADIKKISFKLEKGKAYDLYVDGKKIPKDRYQEYQKYIDDTVSDLKEAEEDIYEAMEDVQELNIEDIHKDIESAINNINIEEIIEDIKEAQEEIENINIEAIMKQTEEQLKSLEDIEYDYIDIETIHREIERAQAYIKESIDWEELRNESFENINIEEIKAEIEENMETMRKELKEDEIFSNEYDKEKMLKEMQEELQKIEKLELE